MRFDWRIVLGVLIASLLLVPMWMLLSEWNHIRKTPGGLKAWVADLASVNYRTAWANYASIVIVVAFSAAIVAHAVFGPALVGELQVEAVYAVFFFLGTLQGLNVAAYIGKRATASPEMVAATAAAAAPDVLPQVTTSETVSTESASGSSRDTSSTTTVTPVQAPDSAPVTVPESAAPLPLLAARRPFSPVATFEPKPKPDPKPPAKPERRYPKARDD